MTRQQGIDDLKHWYLDTGGKEEDFDNYLLFTHFTCDKCSHRNSCELAYDLYNINGDCLTEK